MSHVQSIATDHASMLALVKAAIATAPDVYPWHDAETRGAYCAGPKRATETCAEVCGPGAPQRIAGDYRDERDARAAGRFTSEQFAESERERIGEDWHGPVIPRGDEKVTFAHAIGGARGRYTVRALRRNLESFAAQVSRARLAFDGKAKRAPKRSAKIAGAAAHVTARAMLADDKPGEALSVAEAAGAVIFGRAPEAKPGEPAPLPSLHMLAETITAGGHQWAIVRTVHSGRFGFMHAGCGYFAHGPDARDGFGSSAAAIDNLTMHAECDAWRAKVNGAVAKAGPFDQSAALALWQDRRAADDARGDAPADDETSATDAPAAEACEAAADPIERAPAPDSPAFLAECEATAARIAAAVVYASEAAAIDRRVRAKIEAAERDAAEAAAELAAAPTTTKRRQSAAARLAADAIRRDAEAAASLAADPDPDETAANGAKTAAMAQTAAPTAADMPDAAAPILGDPDAPAAMVARFVDPPTDPDPAPAAPATDPGIGAAAEALARIVAARRAGGVQAIGDAIERGRAGDPDARPAIRAALIDAAASADPAEASAAADALEAWHAAAAPLATQSHAGPLATQSQENRPADGAEKAGPSDELHATGRDTQAPAGFVFASAYAGRLAAGLTREDAEREAADSAAMFPNARFAVGPCAQVIGRFEVRRYHAEADRVPCTGPDCSPATQSHSDAIADMARPPEPPATQSDADRENAEALAAFENAAAQSERRAMLAQCLADCAHMPEFGGSVAFAKQTAHGYTWRALAGPDMSGGDPFRVTWFDEMDGAGQAPSGHSGFATLAEACAEALARGYEPCDAADAFPPATQSQAAADPLPTQSAPDYLRITAEDAERLTPDEARALVGPWWFGCEGSERIDSPDGRRQLHRAWLRHTQDAANIPDAVLQSHAMAAPRFDAHCWFARALADRAPQSVAEAAAEDAEAIAEEMADKRERRAIAGPLRHLGHGVTQQTVAILPRRQSDAERRRANREDDRAFDAEAAAMTPEEFARWNPHLSARAVRESLAAAKARHARTEAAAARLAARRAAAAELAAGERERARRETRGGDRLRAAANRLHVGRVYPLAIFGATVADGRAIACREVAISRIAHSGGSVVYATADGRTRAFECDALHLAAAILRGARELARKAKQAAALAEAARAAAGALLPLATHSVPPAPPPATHSRKRKKAPRALTQDRKISSAGYGGGESRPPSVFRRPDGSMSDAQSRAQRAEIDRAAMAMFRELCDAIAKASPDAIPLARLLDAEAARLTETARTAHGTEEYAATCRKAAQWLTEAASAERERDPVRAAADEAEDENDFDTYGARDAADSDDGARNAERQFRETWRELAAWKAAHPLATQSHI